MKRRNSLLALGLAGGLAVAAGWYWLANGSGRPGDSTLPITLPADIHQVDPQIAELIDEAASAIRQAPSEASLRRKLGMVYHANRMYDLAVACYEQAIQLDDRDAHSRYYLARCRHDLGEIEQACATMAQAAELAPDFSACHWRLGQWMLEQGDSDSAEAAFRKALAIEPQSVPARAGLARVFMQRRENDQAIVLLEEAQPHAGPNEPYINQLLAAAYQRAGRNDQTDAALARAGRGGTSWSDPWSAELDALEATISSRLHYASSLAARGQLDQAVAYLNNLHKLRPDDPAVLTAIATCYRDHGRFDESIASLEQALQLEPDSHFVHTHLALVKLSKSRQTQPQEASFLRAQALTHVEKALASNPSFAPAHGVRGDILLAGGEKSGTEPRIVDQAIQSYLAAFAIDQSAPTWLMRAGRTQFDHERWHDAAGTFERAIRHFPQLSEAWYYLGRTRAKLGDDYGALAALREAQRLNPGEQLIAAAIMELER